MIPCKPDGASSKPLDLMAFRRNPPFSENTQKAAPLSSGLKCVLLPLSSIWMSPFVFSVCKHERAAVPAVSYDNSANNPAGCFTAAAHNELMQTGRKNYPCLCLCFGFSQMIRMLPFLLMTLHFSQIGLTDDLTFTANPPFHKGSSYAITHKKALFKSVRLAL